MEASSSGVPSRSGEQHRLPQPGLELLGLLALAVDGRVDQAGRDGVDPYGDRGEVSSDRERHADDAALGGGVRRLPDLTLERRDAGQADDGAALTRRRRLEPRHRRPGDADHVEGADQVDSDDLLVQLEVVRRLVGAVASDGAGSGADAGRVDQDAQLTELGGALDRRGDLRGVGDVDVGEGRRRAPRPGPGPCRPGRRRPAPSRRPRPAVARPPPRSPTRPPSRSPHTLRSPWPDPSDRRGGTSPRPRWDFSRAEKSHLGRGFTSARGRVRGW